MENNDTRKALKFARIRADETRKAYIQAVNDYELAVHPTEPEWDEVDQATGEITDRMICEITDLRTGQGSPTPTLAEAQFAEERLHRICRLRAQRAKAEKTNAKTAAGT
jgi:hypothetical protein